MIVNVHFEADLWADSILGNQWQRRRCRVAQSKNNA